MSVTTKISKRTPHHMLREGVKMKYRKVCVAAFVTGLSLIPSAYSADHSVMFGYAQTDLSGVGGNLNGYTVKYRYEGAGKIGFIASSTLVSDDSKSYSYGGEGITESGRNEYDYTSFHVGPVYRFNNVVSAYATVGYASYSLERRSNKASSKLDDDNFAGGIGLEFNIRKHLVIDGAVEYSKHMNSTDALTYAVSVGYRF